MADSDAVVMAAAAAQLPALHIPDQANWISNESVFRRLLDTSQVSLDEYKERAKVYRKIDAGLENLCCLYGISQSEVFDVHNMEAFKNVAQAKVKTIRESWGSRKESLEAIPDDDQSIAAQLQRSFSKCLQDQIMFLVTLVIKTADNHLQNAEVQASPQNLMFFHKMRADFSRYLAEVANSEENVNIAKRYDNEAWQYVLSLNLGAKNSSFLGFVLNRSVTLREVAEDLKGAIEFTEEYANKAKVELEQEEESQDSLRCHNIIKLMNENLELWKSELAEDENGGAADEQQQQPPAAAA